MNKQNLFFAVFSMLFLLASCVKDDCTRVMTYTKYEAVYKSYDEIRVNPVAGPAEALKNPGKIYLYGSLILINEQDKGIHIIDNANPAAPSKMGFISIPGNIDIAVQGSTLYADNYTDLLAIDISDIQNVRLTKRIHDAFPSYGVDPDKGVLVKYVGKEVTEEVKCNDPNSFVFDNNSNRAQTTTFGGGATSTGGGRDAVGIGGSMARFTITNGNLYVIDNQDMYVYDINMPSNPTRVNQVNVGWGIETIFPYTDKLFIGSSTGMYIYDNSNPSNPTYLSQFDHVGACDPVYVDGNFAYVTLRSGTPCQGFTNQLDVVDITNITNPSLVSTTPMSNPHGLSVENDKLYLCDGRFGLKVFDVTNKTAIGQNQLFHNASIPTYDVITVPNANRILVIGDNGFYQYETSTPSALQLLSQIPIEK